jgi:hypothetical protein
MGNLSQYFITEYHHSAVIDNPDLEAIKAMLKDLLNLDWDFLQRNSWGKAGVLKSG